MNAWMVELVQNGGTHHKVQSLKQIRLYRRRTSLYFLVQLPMKTKFVRFNKLPKIDGMNGEVDTDHRNSRDPRQAPASTSHLRKVGSDSHRSQNIFESLEYLIKKMGRPAYDLEARDRQVIVQLPDVEELDDDTMKEWVTEVVSCVFSSAFNAISHDLMNEQHAKCFCSENILKNMLFLTKRFRLKKQQIRVIDSHISERLIPYFQRKYPLTQVKDVSKAIDDSVKPIDNRQALDNDMLKKCNVVFTYRQSGDYNDLIMKFLNQIMETVDDKTPRGKTFYEEFYDDTSKLFENVFDESWMNLRAQESVFGQVPSMMNREASHNQQQQQMTPEQPQIPKKTEAELEKYAAQVKEYTHYAIGRKISKNVPTFSQQQINTGYLTIKSPAILRILTKWCNELWSKFTKKNYFLDRQENMRVQQVGGNVNTMFMWMKQPLNDMIEQEKVSIEEFMSAISRNNYDQQAELFMRELERDGFTHVERYEKACGKFAYKTVNNLHRYIILYLNRIIHGLLTVSKKLYDEKLSTKARWTSPPDLLTFKIGDLMRCKCSSKERQILKIFQELQRRSDEHPKEIKIIRVKNRLKMGTRDILINVLYMDRFLCEIQLAVKSATSKFIQNSNSFSHYIYQLGRSLFGPLTELCSIWNNQDPRMVEYLNIIKNQPRVVVAEPTGCRRQNKEHNYKHLRRPFICDDCNIHYSHTNFIWMHQKCDTCQHKICARCRLENQDQELLKDKLLQSEDSFLRNSCRDIVNRKIESERKIPTYGVCIQIEATKIKVQKFKKLEVKRIMTVFGLGKNKKGKQKVFKLNELIHHNAERKFFRKYLVFELPQTEGDQLIPITIDRAKKEFILPQKMKEVYKKEKQILSLIDQNLDTDSIDIIKGPEPAMACIKNLELADNKLQNIKTITQNFKNLNRLQLSRNKVSDISTISTLKSMKKLNLRNNQLNELPDQLCSLSNLKGINIRYNKIAELPQNFGKLTNLDKLEADNNLIAEVPDGFEKLTKLKFVDLSKNKLTAVPRGIENFKRLETLALAKNNLGSMPDWVGTLTELQVLDLSGTKLNNFPSSISSLVKLRTFKIESSVDKLPEDLGNLKNLDSLVLQMPNVTHLPDSMEHLHELTELCIEGCQVHDLPDWLSEMRKLCSFSMINNGLNSLSNQLTEMVKLQFLRIEGQNITEVPFDMKNLVNLRTVSFNNNKLKELPIICTYFPKLYSITAKNNQIEQIDHGFFNQIPQVENLQLDNNKLKHLPTSIQRLRRPKKISYEGNPLEDSPEWLQMVKELVDAVNNNKGRDGSDIESVVQRLESILFESKMSSSL